jgi:hypothetical protein
VPAVAVETGIVMLFPEIVVMSTVAPLGLIYVKVYGAVLPEPVKVIF